MKQNGFSDEPLHTLFDLLSNRKQRIVLSGKNSPWTNVHAGVVEWSVVGPLLFSIDINDLLDNLNSNAKHFADDTSLSSVIRDVNTSSKELNDNLKKVNDWAFQCTLGFYGDPSKQAQEIFSVTNQRDRPTYL